jgi:hypothetical protein
VFHPCLVDDQTRAFGSHRVSAADLADLAKDKEKEGESLNVHNRNCRGSRTACLLTAHRARVKALSTWLQGLLLLCEASLSGLGRGATLLDEEKTFGGLLSSVRFVS